ncbi:hypothetical protein HIM_10808 [Hirsutella minnesotensis 3608]|uniref:Uncharacterized protein n=1 Tax=Hirsutella minnesotensis 3608 TaxID=1043627 RepID=A0A0F7ZJN7_9HYPO|nr:hypothetical protein HIM_10808 [Hirsutella minnesotensis 3608]
MFFLVRDRNILTRPTVNLAALKNAASSLGGNVAVKYTVCIPHSHNIPPNSNICRLNFWLASNNVWHSSTTTLSNACRPCKRLTKYRNPFVTADSGVTNTILDIGWLPRLCQTCDWILLFSQCACISSRNDTNGTTTIVVPSDALNGERRQHERQTFTPARPRDLNDRALAPCDTPYNLLLLPAEFRLLAHHLTQLTAHVRLAQCRKPPETRLFALGLETATASFPSRPRTAYTTRPDAPPAENLSTSVPDSALTSAPLAADLSAPAQRHPT